MFGERTEYSGTFRHLMTPLTVGVLLRLGYFLGGGSLWFDEIAIARHIINRNFQDLLLRPLDPFLAAPFGFLALEKSSCLLFGRSEYALRGISLLAGIAGLLLFARLVTRVLTGAESRVATWIFALAQPLIICSADAKPYAIDLFFSVLLTEFAARKPYDRAFWRKFAVLAVTAFLFSYTSIIVAGGLAAGIHARKWLSNEKVSPPSVKLALSTALAIALVLFLHGRSIHPGVHSYMLFFWAHGFFPVSQGVQSLLWPWKQLTESFRYLFQLPAPAICAGFPFVGALGWILIQGGGLYLGVFPVLLALAVSATGIQPLMVRQMMFLTPHLILLLAGIRPLASKGLHFFRLFLSEAWLISVRNRLSLLGRIIPVLLILPVAISLFRAIPRFNRQNVFPVLQFVQRNKLSQDAVYFSFGAWEAADFYGPRYGFVRGAYAQGQCHREQPWEYYNEIVEAALGRARVWVITTFDRNHEFSSVLQALDGVATRRLETSTPGISEMFDVSAVLFDFGSPLSSTRLNSLVMENPLKRTGPLRSAGPYFENCEGLQHPVSLPLAR